MLCLRCVTSLSHSYDEEPTSSISCSSCYHDFPNFAVENEQQMSKVFFPFSLDKLQWNEKSSLSKPMQVFISANSKWEVDKSFNWKLKLLCSHNKKLNVNLNIGHCCCLSHSAYLHVLQQHLNKINNRILRSSLHVKYLIQPYHNTVKNSLRCIHE